MTVILPIIAALSVTSEWTQRTGLATFTLVPHRGRVLLAKALGSVLVAFASTVVAFAVAALGNVVAAQLAGITPVWDGDAALDGRLRRAPSSCCSSPASPSAR